MPTRPTYRPPLHLNLAPFLLGIWLLGLGTWDFALTQPGSLDNTFSADGIQTTAIGSGGDIGQSVAIQSDGKIVVVGYSGNPIYSKIYHFFVYFCE